MTDVRRLDHYLTRYPAVAVLVYLTVVGLLVLGAYLSLAGLRDSYAALRAATEMLETLEGRKQSAATGHPAGPVPAGSPFLEGQTVTIAGAALQQRVATAVTRVRGDVQSSQVDLQGTEAKNGFVSLTVSLEVDQPGLQQLLYDLEAGMPFLFIDQLMVESPQGVTGPEGGRLRVLMEVSGQWQAAK